MSSTGPVNYAETIPNPSSGIGTLIYGTLAIAYQDSNALIRLKIDTAHFKSFRLDTLNGDQQRLIDIEQWGTVRWNSMEKAFKGARHNSSSRIFRICRRLVNV
ncbi:MAG: hypothetical protein IPN26_10860 [Bacteroidetes bacterium]|nr:hypothetical protein [Bacteroidota bacterium]